MRELSKEQLIQGGEAAIENAAALVAEAELLHENCKWARTVFLCQIAGEELGKYVLIGSALLELAVTTKLDWRRFWKRYLSHKSKLKLITYAEDIFLGQSCLDGYHESVRRMVDVLETGKQMALYSDFADGRFYVPSNIVRESIATDALIWAQGRLQYANCMRKITEKPLPDDVVKKGFHELERLIGIELLGG